MILDVDIIYNLRHVGQLAHTHCQTIFTSINTATFQQIPKLLVAFYFHLNHFVIQIRVSSICKRTLKYDTPLIDYTHCFDVQVLFFSATSQIHFFFLLSLYFLDTSKKNFQVSDFFFHFTYFVFYLIRTFHCDDMY